MSTTLFTTCGPEQGIRARCRAIWESGDYGILARYHEAAAVEFVARLALRAGDRVLDVACGTGNVAVPAARAGCSVTGLDLASNLVTRARARAASEGLAIGYTEGDAEALPFPDGSFDWVTSQFGIMYAARPDRATAELLRVCRPGGGVALANWTAEGPIGEFLRTIDELCPARVGGPPTLLWGDEAIVRARLGGSVADLRIHRRAVRLRFPFAPRQTVDLLRQFLGPVTRAFATLEPPDRAGLAEAFEDLFRRHNQARDGSTELGGECLEAVGFVSGAGPAPDGPDTPGSEEIRAAAR